MQITCPFAKGNHFCFMQREKFITMFCQARKIFKTFNDAITSMLAIIIPLRAGVGFRHCLVVSDICIIDWCSI